MRRFSALYETLDQTTSTNAKVAALAAYFRDAPQADAAWATFFLTGRRLKRVVPSAGLRQWAQEVTQIPEWLLAECYSAAGDFGELVALALDAVPPGPAEPDLPLATWVEDRLLPLQKTDPAGQRTLVTRWWLGLPRGERFLLNKLLTGEFRVGVAHTLVVRALALSAGIEPTKVAARLMGDWMPSAEWFTAVVAAEEGAADPSQPYPFFLAASLEGTPEALGDRADGLVEWKWDGIRAQLVRRHGETWLWSRGEELITRRFPEIIAAASHLPDGTVLDGEVLAFTDGTPMPFSALQQRIGREKQVAQVMRTVPVVFVAFDVLERGGVDVRTAPIHERRDAVLQLTTGSVLRASDEVTAPTWDELARLREESRQRGVEGFILKRRDAERQAGV